MRASHRLVEKNYRASDHIGKVLEIGAGTGEHLAFVKYGFDEYALSDLSPKTLNIAEKKLASYPQGKLKLAVQSGDHLSYPDSTFDRVIASHVLERIYQPHLALKEWIRVLKPGGTLSILIPTDPGVAWRLGRHFGPRKNALAQGIAYDYVMAREHVNSSNNLIAILRHYYADSTEHWWLFPIPSIFDPRDPHSNSNIELDRAFHCPVSDKKINNGLWPDDRQGDVPVEADTLAKAVKQTRIDYPAWKNAKRYKIECRASEEG